MRPFLIIILSLISTRFLAQNILEHSSELIFQTQGVGKFDYNTFFIEPVEGFVQYNKTDSYWYLVDDAEIRSITIQGEYIGYDEALDVIYSDDLPQGNTFWITKNKMTIRNGISPYEEKFHFYIDYLHSDLGSSAQIDLTIRFNSNNQVYYYPGLWMDTNTTGTMTQIIEGATLNIWDVYGNVRSTDGFELYLTLSSQDNHPKLLWNPYHAPDELESYKIYKSKNSIDFSLLTIVNSNTLEYMDYSEMLYSGTGKSTKVYYYILASLDNNQTSPNSNTVSARVNQEINKASTSPQHSSQRPSDVEEFKLNQNYPNLRLRLC